MSDSEHEHTFARVCGRAYINIISRFSLEVPLRAHARHVVDRGATCEIRLRLSEMSWTPEIILSFIPKLSGGI